MVLHSECECIVYFLELTIPFEDVIEAKVCRTGSGSEGTSLASTNRRPVEIGAVGFVAKSTTILLLDFGFHGRSLIGALKGLSEAAEKVVGYPVTCLYFLFMSFC